MQPTSTLTSPNVTKPFSLVVKQGVFSSTYDNTKSANPFSKGILTQLFTLLSNIVEETRVTLLNTWKCLAGEGFIQIKVASLVFIADALISDDEPL